MDPHSTSAPRADYLTQKAVAKKVEDIRERREETQAQRQLGVILRGITEGVTMQKPTGEIIYANDLAAKLVGFESVEEFLNTPVREIMSRFEMLDEEGKPLPITELPGRKALMTGQATERLIRFRIVESGEDRWSLTRAVPVFAEDGSIEYAVNFFRDVTDKIRQEEREKFLSKASFILSSTLDYEATLKSIAELVVPKLADWCTVHIKDDGTIRQLAVTHADPAKIAWALEIQKDYPPDPTAKTGVAEVIRSGKPLLVVDINEQMLRAAARDEHHLALIRQLGMQSAMTVPMIARDRTIGAITFILAEQKRNYGQQDLAFATELAGRAALAVENARLHREAVNALATIQELNKGLERKVEERTKELQQSREKLHAQYKRLQSIITHLPIAAVAVDENTTILQMNEMFCTLFGVKLWPEDMVGRNGEEFTHAFNGTVDEPERLGKEFQEMVDKRVPTLGREIVLSDGRILSQDYLPIFENGTYHGYLLLFRDITKERRIDAAKSEFMSLASHQLRTPLTTIRWTFSILSKRLQEAITSDDRRMLQEGRDAAARMSETIDTMLAISRIESGAVEIREKNIILEDFLRNLVKDYAGDYRKEGQKLEIESPSDLSLRTDPTLLNELFDNLLSNALKYTPATGSVVLRAHETRDGIRIDVADTGYGIPIHQHKEVFRKFFRGDNVISKETSGTGLGLYLASLIAGLLNARITFQSDEDTGTTFSVHFTSSNKTQETSGS